MAPVALTLLLVAAAPVLGNAGCQTVADKCFPVVGSCSIFPCDKYRGAVCVKEKLFGTIPLGQGRCECPKGTCGLNGKCVPPTTCMTKDDTPGTAAPAELAEEPAAEANVQTTGKYAAAACSLAAAGLLAGVAVKASRGLMGREEAVPAGAEEDATPSVPYAPLVS